jgi:hypothetical protein
MERGGFDKMGLAGRPVLYKECSKKQSRHYETVCGERKMSSGKSREVTMNWGFAEIDDQTPTLISHLGI